MGCDLGGGMFRCGSRGRLHHNELLVKQHFKVLKEDVRRKRWSCYLSYQLTCNSCPMRCEAGVLCCKPEISVELWEIATYCTAVIWRLRHMYYRHLDPTILLNLCTMVIRDVLYGMYVREPPSHRITLSTFSQINNETLPLKSNIGTSKIPL